MTQGTGATYLIGRLKQAALRHAFGVPGDYVLSFMDRLMEEGIELVGTGPSCPHTPVVPVRQWSDGFSRACAVDCDCT